MNFLLCLMLLLSSCITKTKVTFKKIDIIPSDIMGSIEWLPDTLSTKPLLEIIAYSGVITSYNNDGSVYFFLPNDSLLIYVKVETLKIKIEL